MDNEKGSRGIFARFLDLLISIGLGEWMLRGGTTLLSVVMIGVVVWLVQSFYAQPVGTGSVAEASVTESAMVAAGSVNIPPQDVNAFDGILRVALPFTTIPSRPRQDIVKYVVEKGDTVFGIAQKFGLQPETVLWGNYGILLDNPHSLKEGQELLIMPSDGVYWQWLSANKGGLPGF